VFLRLSKFRFTWHMKLCYILIPFMLFKEIKYFIIFIVMTGLVFNSVRKCFLLCCKNIFYFIHYLSKVWDQIV